MMDRETREWLNWADRYERVRASLAPELAELRHYEHVRQLARAANPQQALWCEQCGLRTPIDRHHPDYAEPTRIVWLCRRCHRMVHPTGKAHEVQARIDAVMVPILREE